MERIGLERTYRFSASHRYYRPDWSAEENRRRFGKCSNVPGHGHNYRLTVTVRGAVDPATGFIVDLPELDRVVQSTVLERLDHQQIDHAVAEFAPGAAIPSSENLVLWIRERLRAELSTDLELASIRLAEDDDLAAVWSSSPSH